MYSQYFGILADAFIIIIITRSRPWQGGWNFGNICILTQIWSLWVFCEKYNVQYYSLQNVFRPLTSTSSQLQVTSGAMELSSTRYIPLAWSHTTSGQMIRWRYVSLDRLCGTRLWHLQWEAGAFCVTVVIPIIFSVPVMWHDLQQSIFTSHWRKYNEYQQLKVTLCLFRQATL